MSIVDFDAREIDGLVDRLLEIANPRQIRNMARSLAGDTLKSVHDNIDNQETAEGIKWDARRRTSATNGRRRKAKMLSGFKRKDYMNVHDENDGFAIKFKGGKTLKIAREHHEGAEITNASGVRYKIPARPFLGLSPTARQHIHDRLSEYVGGLSDR